MDTKALLELAKTAARAVWFGLLGVISTVLLATVADENLLRMVWSIGEITLPVGVWVAAAVSAAVKLIDRYVHTSKSKANGLAPTFLQK